MMRVLLVAALLAGCRATPTADEPAPPLAAPDAMPEVRLPAEVTELRFALTPYLTPESLIRQHEGFRAWLEKRLHVPVKLVVADSYDGLAAMMERHEADLAAFSPYAYVRAQHDGTRFRPIVSIIAEGSARAAGYVVVRQDSPVSRLDDLRDKRVAFVDPASTAGWLMPTALLLKRGMVPGRDLTAAFLGTHDAVLQAVHDGRYHAGAVYQGALDAFARKTGVSRHAFRIVGKTDRMPRDVYCVRNDAPEALADALNTLLTSFSTLRPEGQDVLGPMDINGFVAASEDAFDVVREADRMVRQVPLPAQAQPVPAPGATTEATAPAPAH
jgi:phosphonate transport system substrate-binding protein